MNIECGLELAKDMLAKHVQFCMPIGERHVANVDLVALDAHVCTLVATMLSFEGNLQELNAYCETRGLRDFYLMVLDAQTTLDQVLPELRSLESRQYFARLSQLSVVIAEMTIAQTPEIFHQTLLDDESEETMEEESIVNWREDCRKTADLDEELLEFRKGLARQKLKTKGRFGKL